ncbi:MAG: glycosyltransferase family 39 protein, partial [Anaerolineae bacterium]|nr:glycosyltransferase family 39 protein [Anaerolineae bacterium]
MTRHAHLLLLLTLFGFALRMLRAANWLMWGDEGFSVFSASRDLLTITLDTTTIDPHPPLYYYLLHFYFAIFGRAELAVRFFSIFFGTATIPLVWQLGKRMFDARVGMLAAFFVTIAPFAVHYSQEIRMYALAMFLTTLGLYAFIRLYERDVRASRGEWLLYALFLLLALYTLYHTAFIFLAIGLVLLTQFRARRAFVMRWFVTAFGIVALFLPWLLYKYVSAFSGIKQVAGDTVPMDILTFIARGWAAISVGTTIPLHHAFLLAGLYAACIGIGIAILLITRAGKLYDALLVALTLVPILGYYPLYLAMPLYRGRLFALACIPLFILLARSVQAIAARARWLALVPLMLVIGTSAYSTSNYFVNYQRYSAVVEDYLPAIREIAARARADDVVLFHAYWQRGYFLSYYTGAPLQYGALDDQADLQRAVARARNVWAITQTLAHHPAEDWLAQNAFPLGEQAYGKMRVMAYRAGTPSRGETFASPIEFDNGMQLLGYRFESTTLDSERGIVLVRLDWRAARAIAENYNVSVQVTNARSDVEWARADAAPANGTQPTATWHVGQRIADHRVVMLPIGTPPGDYAIQIRVYDARERIARIVAPEHRQGHTLRLGEVTLGRY